MALLVGLLVQAYNHEREAEELLADAVLVRKAQPAILRKLDAEYEVVHRVEHGLSP